MIKIIFQIHVQNTHGLINGIRITGNHILHKRKYLHKKYGEIKTIGENTRASLSHEMNKTFKARKIGKSNNV